MSEQSTEPPIFKLWKCPICGDLFNHRVTEAESAKGMIICPNCYSEVSILKKKSH